MASVSAASAASAVLPFGELGYRSCENIIEEIVASREDVILSPEKLAEVTALSQKLQRIRATVGYGNFNLLGFDEMYKAGAEHPAVGTFSSAETELFESLFYQNAVAYGFYGEKVFTSLTDTINKGETVKVPGTGHYLYNGRAAEMYAKVRRDVGESIVLTSGVRSIVKQMDLFLRKVVSSRGNVSVASRSLAPAGYSYHGIGDFDVGKVGFGTKNFTSDFARTDEFKRLIDLGYVQIRYPKGNPFGVRYEPWHVKVV